MRSRVRTSIAAKCECQTCKRAWWAAGRPHPKDCPEHGVKEPAKTVYDHIREAADDES